MTSAMLAAGCATGQVMAPAEGSGAAIAASTVRYQWDLADLYVSDAAWEAAFTDIEKRIAALPRHRGTLGRDAATMLAAYADISAVTKEAYRIYMFASLKRDEDQRVPEAQTRFGRAQAMFAGFGESVSWINPELLAIGPEKIEAFLKAEKGLAPFSFQLRDTVRAAPHTLDADGEAMLAGASLALGQPQQIYGLYANASIPWPTITLSDGTELKVDQSGYSRGRQLTNRADRKLVFDTFWGAWKQYENGMGATLNAQVQGAVFNARARKYEGVLESAMFSNALPPEIYTQLVSQVNAGLPTFHRYLKLRGKMLGISELRYYDIYPPIISANTGVFDLKRSEEITFAALAPFGEEYLGMLRTGLSSKWMHSHPQEGKQSGAYMAGMAYDEHPYVLLNHNDDYESMSTFAHEWGHAVHTMLSNKAQPFETASYSTFIAEMASISSEILLQEYMIANSKTKEEKLFYLGASLELARGSFFRQTMFGEFELAIHRAAEQGQPLTGPMLTLTYGELLRRYHGQDQGVMQIDDVYAQEWAFIPHFYMGFYVYQYATAISGATWFAEQFLAGDTKVRDSFLNALKAGGSDHPHQILLTQAGLDMTKPDAYQAVVRRMNSIMDRMEALLAE
ncbi:MAG: M3 family oligoendopeptidase [Hyphomonadaceae bacterium]|nr:M3 family oligoendopeptidase [Hyphomonadaceae bacterium]